MRNIHLFGKTSFSLRKMKSRFFAACAFFSFSILHGKLFWSDFTTYKIQSSNLDGSGIIDVVSGLSNPKGDLAIDSQNRKVYWIDSGSGELQRSDLNGSNMETLVTGIGIGGRGLDLDIDNGHIYWGDYTSNKIERINLDGTNRTVILPSLQGIRA